MADDAEAAAAAAAANANQNEQDGNEQHLSGALLEERRRRRREAEMEEWLRQQEQAELEEAASGTVGPETAALEPRENPGEIVIANNDPAVAANELQPLLQSLRNAPFGFCAIDRRPSCHCWVSFGTLCARGINTISL
jgi:hypothetical protein